MAELSAPALQTLPPQTVPQKRPLGADEKHAPTVASPLNPDIHAMQKKPRDQREKKATYKARGVSPDPMPTKKNTGGSSSSNNGTTSTKKSTKDPSVPSPMRYSLPNPKLADFDAPKAPQLVPGLRRARSQFYEATEHISNKRNFRYTRCICDPSFPFSLYHRQSETEPYGPRISFEDTSPHVQFDESMRSITTEKGYRMARTNVGCREGRWYYECRVKSGIRSAASDSIEDEDEKGGHVRVGWARREANLDGPVGFDAYSYGLRDVGGQKVHMSRPKDFAIPAADFCQGDVIGLEIVLPSLALHRKVVSGVYNKAVDVSDDVDPLAILEYPDTIRDRIPIRYKNHLYFEQFEYHPTKDLEELMNPSQTTSTATAGPPGESDPPNPNHPQVPLRTLPFSCIKVYKNGQLLGPMFEDLLAFLPPASKPIATAGAREGLDDGMLGYFPAVSVFRGGAVEMNFGPDFWFPPSDLCVASYHGEQKQEGGNGYMGSDKNGNGNMGGDNNSNIAGDGDSVMQEATSEVRTKEPGTSPSVHHDHHDHHRLRPISERFNEQIAEDIVYDIVDEVDFWAQDGGELSQDGQSVKQVDGSGGANSGGAPGGPSGGPSGGGTSTTGPTGLVVGVGGGSNNNNNMGSIGTTNTTTTSPRPPIIESETPGTVASAMADAAGGDISTELKDMMQEQQQQQQG